MIKISEKLFSFNYIDKKFKKIIEKSLYKNELNVGYGVAKIKINNNKKIKFDLLYLDFHIEESMKPIKLKPINNENQNT